MNRRNIFLTIIRLCGVVYSGVGEGSKYVEMYRDVLRKHLGINPFPGTLNVDFGFDTRNVLPLDRALIIPPPFSNLNPVYVFRTVVNNRVNGFLIKPFKTRYSWRILEVISEYNLRNELRLRDGDFVELIIMV